MAIPLIYDLNQLMLDFKTCAAAAGFCNVKLGSPEKINFDHNICYDLLNIDYPSSYIVEGIKEVYTFNLVIARPIQSGSTQGVQIFDNDTVAITVDPCSQGPSSPPSGCDEPCQDYFGACGCTDPVAINYNPGAGVDDGTCCYGAGEEPCVDDNGVFPPAFPANQTSNPN